MTTHQETKVMRCVGKWFTPNRAVFCLTTVCTLNYLDRGIISGAALEIKGCALNFDQCDLRPGENQTGLHDCLYDCKACTCPGETQTGFGINSQQLGYLQSAFMIGYSLSSLVYSKLVHTVRPFKIISIALWLWILAVVLSGLSGLWCTQQQNAMAKDQDELCSAFYLAVVARALSGVGEAATATIAVVYLDDALPPARKGVLFAIYFSAIPCGTAMGFIYAGQIAALGKWEWAFMAEAPLMVFFAIGSYFIPFRLQKQENTAATKNNTGMTRRPSSFEHLSAALLTHDANVEYHERERQRTSSSVGTGDAFTPPRTGHGCPSTDASSLSSSLPSSLPSSLAPNSTALPEPPSTFSELAACFASPVYLLTCGGYASYTAVVAGFSFYGPMYIRERKEWNYTESEADLVFGGIIVVTGLLGTGLGGYLLDKGSGNVEGSARLVPALGQVFVEVTLGACFCVLAGLCETAMMFFICLAFGVFVMFMTTSGVNVALMWSVPPEHRAMAMALSVIIIHSFGDVPSPVVIGAIDRSQTPTTTFLATSSWLAIAVLCWGLAWAMAKKRLVQEKTKESTHMSGIEELDSEMGDEERRSSGLGPLDPGRRIQASPPGYVYEHPYTEDEDTEDDLSPVLLDWRQRDM